jgi:hypothetical protein
MDVKSSPTPSPSFLALPGQRHAHMKVTAGWSIAWERCQPGTGRSALANVEVRKLSTHVRFDAARMGAELILIPASRSSRARCTLKA